MKLFQFTVHTVNYDQLIWMMLKRRSIDERSESIDLRSKSHKGCVKYLMRVNQITEASPLTVKGSFTPDLLLSKLWLWQQLVSVLDRLDIDHVHAVYILGSWTGGVGLVLASEHFPADVMINVDSDRRWIQASKMIARRMGFDDRVQHQVQDANQVDYDQAKPPSVVINTSTNDIAGRDWFDHIPTGTIVVLQGRDLAGSAQSWSSLSEFVKAWPLQQVWFQGELPLKDPETSYYRYMVIGQR